MKKFSRLYVKYMIKTPILFYSFLAVGITLLLYLSLTVKLDIMQNVNCIVEADKIVIEGNWDAQLNVIYLYKDRNVKINKLIIKQTVVENGQTVFVINNPSNLSGDYQADIVTGKQSVFERIFLKVGKG